MECALDSSLVNIVLQSLLQNLALWIVKVPEVGLQREHLRLNQCRYLIIDEVFRIAKAY